MYVAVRPGVPGHLNSEKAQNLVDKFANFGFVDFDEYAKLIHNVCVLTEDPSRMEGYTCTCKKNAKEFWCAHSLGVAIIRGTIVVPQAARRRLLGRKLARGRRANVGPAWEHAPFNLDFPIHHPQQALEILAGHGAEPVLHAQP